jgi:EAL domain-containing protein (putative c-di-GMP-specific phosphodiesterase class I)
MALSFLKTKTGRTKSEPKSFDDDARAPLVTAVLVITLGGVTALAFISPELSILALAITALIGFAALGNKTGNQNGNLTAAVRKLREDHNNLAREVSIHTKDISVLRDDLAMVKTAEVMLKKEEKSGLLDVANDDPYATASTLSDMVVKELVHHAVRSERVDVFIQPVVRLPARKMRFFEIYARIRAKPGLYLPAERYKSIAEQDRLLTQIDNLLLLRCLNILKASAHLKKAAPFFVNVSPLSLKNTAFMKDLLEFAARRRDLAPRLIFEMRQQDFDALSIPVMQIVDGLGKLGCSFSLDHVNLEGLDVPLLQKYRVRFIKIGAKKLISEMANGRRFADVMRIKRKLESNGIGFIAERVEDEHTLKELLDYDIHYGQGYLFGKPDLEGAYRARKAA